MRLRLPALHLVLVLLSVLPLSEQDLRRRKHRDRPARQHRASAGPRFDSATSGGGRGAHRAARGWKWGEGGTGTTSHRPHRADSDAAAADGMVELAASLSHQRSRFERRELHSSSARNGGTTSGGFARGGPGGARGASGDGTGTGAASHHPRRADSDATAADGMVELASSLAHGHGHSHGEPKVEAKKLATEPAGKGNPLAGMLAASKASGAKTLSTTEEATTKEATTLLKAGTAEGDAHHGHAHNAEEDAIKAAQAAYESVDGHHDRAPWASTPRVPAAKKEEAVPVKPRKSAKQRWSGLKGLFAGNLKANVEEEKDDTNRLELLHKAADLISARLQPVVTEEAGKLRLDATQGWYETRRRMVFTQMKRTLPGT